MPLLLRLAIRHAHKVLLSLLSLNSIDAIIPKNNISRIITEPHAEVILNNTTESLDKVFIVKDALEHRSLIFIWNSQYASIPDRKLAVDRRLAQPGNGNCKQGVEEDERD